MAYETPTMGWSSWNTYRVNISESIIKAQADAMVRLGFASKGYKYINIDDGFFGGRSTEDGSLLINATKFPNGLKPVVDHIHGLGLKAGIYSDAGHNTCGSFWDGDAKGVGVGLYEHDQQDANYFFNTLGFDFIKVDFCGGDSNQNSEQLSLDPKTRYTAIAEAIKATGRTDVRLNVCRWAFPGTWVSNVGSSWRISTDIRDNFESVKNIIDKNLYMAAYATEGHFNDMDMLQVGNGSLNMEENKTHFGMWCIMASPLLIGTDLTQIREEIKELLMNEELIALNQDPLALQAELVYKDKGAYVLAKDVETLHGLKRAVAVFNPLDRAVTVKLNFDRLLLGGNIKLRDLYTHEDVATVKATDGFEVTVPAHGTRIYKLTGEQRVEQTIYEAENAYLSNYTDIGSTNNDHIRMTVDAAKSNGAKVGWLGGAGKDNYLERRDVYSPKGGYRAMTVAGTSYNTRKVYVSVNGGEGTPLTFTNGDGYQTIMVKLNAGKNTIRLYNNEDWGPDVDYIEFDKQPSSQTFYKTTTLDATPESGKKYLIYSAATAAVTRQGDRMGLIYVMNTGELSRSKGAVPTVTVAADKPCIFTVEGSVADGITIKTEDGQYLGLSSGKVKLQSNPFTWSLKTDSRVPNSYNIYSGNTYWNGNQNTQTNEALLFATWSDGHPFQFYNYTTETRPTGFDASAMSRMANVGNHAGEVGWLTKEAAESAVAAASTLETATTKYNELNSSAFDVVMPQAGHAYVLQPVWSTGAKGSVMTASPEGLTTSTAHPSTYASVWVAEQNGDGVALKNVATEQYLNLTTMSTTAVKLDFTPQDRVELGALPIKANGQWMQAAAEQAPTKATAKGRAAETTTDYAWQEVKQVALQAAKPELVAGNKPYIVPEGMQAMLVSYDATADELVKQTVTTGVVPANTPFLLTKAEATTAYLLPAENAPAVEQALMVSSQEQTVAEGQNVFFFQADGAQGAGFYRQPTSTVIPAGQGYLVLAQSTKDFYPLDITTALKQVTTQEQEKQPTYDLSGRRVNRSYKGVVVQKGKKTLQR